MALRRQAEVRNASRAIIRAKACSFDLERDLNRTLRASVRHEFCSGLFTRRFPYPSKLTQEE
jgi:hypothetical protein